MSQPSTSPTSDGASASTVHKDQADHKAEQTGPAEAGAGLPPTGPMVLDASFVLALLQRDPGAVALSGVLRRGVLTSVTAGEVYCKVADTAGTDPHRIEGVLRALGVRIVDLPLEVTHHFHQLRRIDTCRRTEQKINEENTAALSLADLCVLGYALASNYPVLTGNRHWVTLTTHGLNLSVYLCQH